MIPFIGFLTKPVVLVLVGVMLTGGVIAGLYKWSNDRCEATLQAAVSEAETKAKQERMELTERFLREQRLSRERTRILMEEARNVANDLPECIQPAGIAGLLNSAIGDSESPGRTDDTSGTPNPDP